MSPIRIADPARHHAEVASDVEERVLGVLRSGNYVGGPVVSEAEQLAAKWFGRRHAVGVASGTDALMLALQALSVRPGDEVIVPALTFFATAGAVAGVGAVPVIVDVREDGCIDPEEAEKAVTDLTAAVVPVHLFGTMAERPNLGVPVVDDSAQAFGGDPPRSLGRLTMLSCYPTKIWGAAGQGGFVIGDDADLLRAMRRLSRHGAGRKGVEHRRVGTAVGRNSRLDAIQAAVLLGHAPKLEERIARRRELASFYDGALPATVKPMRRDAGSPIQQYVVTVDERDATAARLAALGIETRAYYPRSLAEQPALQRRHPTLIADVLCRRVLALPCHPALSDDDAQRVVDAVKKVTA